MYTVYRYDGEDFDCTEEGKDRLALALATYEVGCTDELDYERWLDRTQTASQVMWLVKQYGREETEIMLVEEFCEEYARDHRDDILHDFKDSYEVVTIKEEGEE